MAVKGAGFRWARISLAVFVLSSLLLGVIAQGLVLNPPANVYAQPVDSPATIAPSTVWGPLSGTSGDVEIDVNRTGIAVRVEIPREFLPLGMAQNDTHFIESNIRSDYYYYSSIDEKNYWTYDWRGAASDGPCFKPNFSLRDPNAPWCIEIWNYLNGTFRTFTPPKFIRFHNLVAPLVAESPLAGTYNFTLFVADHTNSLGLPDFVNAWNTTLHVPVSMRDRPGSVAGQICDSWFSPTCPVILGTKGVAYAKDVVSGQIVGRSYVNETTGSYNITGLAPGQYQILASAGFDPTYDVAYSLTTYPNCLVGVQTCNPGLVSILAGQNQGDIVVQLGRAPQVCGLIEYRKGAASLTHSLTGHPYLPEIGFKVLNITVEGEDSQQHVYRNMTLSQNTSSDNFKLMIGSNVNYVGTDPYGTEFAGLPPASSSTSYVLNLNVWITGYLQTNLDGSPETVTAKVSASPLTEASTPCSTPFPNPILMQVGGEISGTIQLWNGQKLETPDQAEASLPLPRPPTDALFGGNILIKAIDHSGILRAISVINGTYPNETTIYKDNSSIPFILFGFTEYFNHTWSGSWDEHDDGLPPDQGYSIQVFIRGYEMQTLNLIQLQLGGNHGGVTIKMVRGGAFQVGVTSYDNRFGTRALQAAQSFLFLNLSIPVRARTYFYDSSGFEVGYVECVIRTGVAQPDRLCRMGRLGQPGSEQNSFTVIFAGQNWDLRDIWFYGDAPTHVGNDTYTIQTYTLGYVWQNGPSQSPNDLLGFAQLSIPLLIGDEIAITGPVFLNLQLLGTLLENDYAIGQALLNGGLSGAVPGNFTEGTSTLSFPIFGFGGMINSTEVVVKGFHIVRLGGLEGQGHFFYVSPEGPHLSCDPIAHTNGYCDYGLDNGTYTAQVPEFGFDWHFMQPVPPSTITFNDLFLETGVVMEDILMAKIVSISVLGQADLPAFGLAPLTWVQVTASNSTFTRTIATLDGTYTGPGALFLPAGNYDFTFSQPAYYTTQPPSNQPLNLQVQWGMGYPSGYTIDPPDGPLCPILPPATTCGP